MLTLLRNFYLKNRLFVSVLIVAAIVSSLLIVDLPLPNKDARSATAPTPSTVNPKDVSINTNINFSESGDQNGDGKFQSLDIAKVSFEIVHKGSGSENLITLETGIDINNFVDIMNIQGTTGYSFVNNKLVINNVTIREDIKNIISFDLLLKAPNDSRLLKTQPVLKRHSGFSIASGVEKTITIEPNADEQINSNVKAEVQS